MKFYYISIISVMLLAAIYLVGTAVLGFCGVWLRKRWKRAWIVMVPLFLLLYAAPVAEEFWIAWNFGQLCKKDAGIFVNKTVEVDGFYDATMRSGFENIEKGGYRFMEHPSRDRTRVEHVEKVNGQWVTNELDHPTARYHYTTNIYGSRAAHKITRQESLVTDKASGAVLGRYVEYGRRSPWFFVGLGEVPYSCDGPDGGPNSKYNRLIYREILKPIK